MPHYMDRSDAISEFINAVSRRENRPLSLLLVDALDVEWLIAWESWVRRVNVFAPDSDVMYHLVNDAVGLDFYQRYNFRIRCGTASQISNDPQVAWPFDVISVTVTEANWKAGFSRSAAWTQILERQIGTSSNFLLVVQGDSHCISLLHDVLGKVRGLVFRPERFLRFRSESVEAAVRVWTVTNEGGTARPRRDVDQAEVTHLILWGEEAL